ncbi:MAG: 50S ribosomal protein L23 [Candidatus Vogelbacteria bacterium RIFOXYD1_FULL_46_19]|uniref:50S ribosomal protein L23 n=1 Tax=Candidatus Vogelbacteria bacterium RIFOXYD1_FULL_46_19 TaxID=1802439 RepID=A0A1G2QH20_9BACT|nr:MAG: 50S ribosomal protein L23 [Candidatus Vogelbacteria bacterium RIFOXYD1_FULL_46_19]
MPKFTPTSSAVVLLRPRITEKASVLTGNPLPVYTFEVPLQAGKVAVRRAIKEKYKIDPVKINIVSLPAKQVVVRGKRGTKARIKKALVYMPAGTQIDFV